MTKPNTNPALDEGICGSCGRVEIMGAYCSYCFAGPFEGIARPTPLDVAAVRNALVRLHGWRSPLLCYEVRRHPERVRKDAAKAGLHMAWPL